MRNLKRALSLLLSSAMVLGMVVMGGSAAGYQDVDASNDNQEAIEVLQAVGIMAGDENGNFNPDASVTRNEMAVVMAHLLNLDYDYYRGVNTFTDVPDWAAPYVAACVAEGVTAGIGNGLYGGDQEITAAQASLMIMKALGYFQYQEDFGSDWQVATIRQASYIDLFDNINANAESALTRGQVAQLVLNGLEADMVYFTGDVGIQIGDVTVGYKAEYTVKSSSDDKYNTLVGGATDIDESDKYIIQLGEELYNGNLTKDSTTDEFGRPSTTWSYNKTEIGTYAVKNDLVATYTEKVAKSDVYSAVGKSVYDDLCDGESNLTVYFDGVKTNVAANDIDSYIEKDNSGKVNNTGNGDLTEVYVDSDHNVTIVTIRTYVFQASSDYDSKKETVSLTTDSTKYDTSITLADKTLDADDFPAIKDFNADDYVLVTATKNSSGKYDVQSVALAEKVTEEVTGYKYDSSVTTSSATYSYNAGTSAIKTTSYNVGKPATLVLDSYGYVIAVDEAVVLSDYVYIKEFANPNGLTTSAKAVAYAIFSDGTYDEITVKEAYDKTEDVQEKDKSEIGSWGTTAAQIGWFTYSKNSANEYTLYNIESKYSEETATYTNPSDTTIITNGQVKAFTTTSTGDADDALFNDETIVVLRDKNGDVTVYTGVKNIPTITLTEAGTATVSVVEKNSNGYATLVYIDVPVAATISGGKDSNLVYVISYDGKYVTTDNEVYFMYTVLDENGDEVKVEADTQIQSMTGDVYQVANYLTENADGRLTDFQLVASDDSGVVIGDTSKSNAISYSAGTLNIGGDKYLLAEDAKITLLTLGKGVDGASNDATVMNKDKDADYEIAANISGKELADAMKGYTYTYDFGGKVSETAGNVITELYVTVKQAANANLDLAEITKVEFAGTEVPFYETEAEAKANPVDVVKPSTGSTGASSDFEGTNIVTTIKKSDASEYTALSNSEWSSGWNSGSTEGGYDVIKIVATSADGTATVTGYIAYQTQTTYTLKITNSNADSAIKVTYNGKDTIVAKSDSDVEIATGLVKDQVITISYVGETGKTIGAATVSGDASHSEFDGSISITVGTSDITVTIADS